MQTPVARETPDLRRTLLQTELSRRCERNPKYSLRAFARALGISHTVLSLVLSGKRRLSSGAAARVAEKLNLDDRVRETFLKTPRAGTALDSELEDRAAFQLLELDRFELIADWRHYAILSLLEVHDAKWDPAWVAGRLGIEQAQAKAAMDRLRRLGLVARDPARGRWAQTGLPIRVENRVSTEATQRFHRQLLSRAQRSLEQDPMNERDFSATTFAIDPKVVPYALERIRTFRRKLVAELEGMAKPREVYQITIQLFPVSRTRPPELKRRVPQ